MGVHSDNGRRGGEGKITPLPGTDRRGPEVELARREPPIPSAREVENLGKLANILAKSGFFKDARGGYQAFAKLLFGRDLGLSATAALTGVNIVEGKPELSANVQAQMVRSYVGVGGERYDYKVVSPKEERHERCEIEFYRITAGRRETLGTSEFTIADAEQAGLTRPRGGQPSNYIKYAPNMLFARAMSNGVAFHCPEVTGGLRVYHEGEVSSVGANGPDVAPAGVVEEISEVEIVAGHEAEDQRVVGSTSDAGDPDNTESKAKAAGEQESEAPTHPGIDPDAGRPSDANPHGLRVREEADARGLGDAQLANLILVAGGAQDKPPEKAAALLDEMLRRIPETIAERALRLIEERHPVAAAARSDATASPPSAIGKDFAAYEPPPAA